MTEFGRFRLENAVLAHSILKMYAFAISFASSLAKLLNRL